jgi:C1A family cysteine protease
MAKFNRQITDVEEFMGRLENFTTTHNWIEQHNSMLGRTWTAGHNQFSDWHAAEYKAQLGYVSEDKERMASTWFEPTNADSVNWIDQGAVTPVKDQGQCGSCWAFSTIASLEGAHAIATGELKSFCEEQVVDCAGIRYGLMGCNGGMQNRAYNYYEAGNDAMLEDDYKYTSGTTKAKGSCQYDASQASNVTVKNYDMVTPNNQSQMKAALDKGVLAVAIEADKRAFQTYQSGILSGDACGTKLDHAVTAVGYGTENGQAYWLIKNSWNTTWGDKGYIKLAMDDNMGTCGVQQDPMLPYSN